jgi:catechol-2,3-dioxygenase
VTRRRRIHPVGGGVAAVAAPPRRYALQFGLTVRDQSADRATLACDYEPYSLELVRTDDPDEVGFAHCAWELRRAVSLDDARAHLRAHGVDVREDDGALVLHDPEGFEYHLYPFREEEDRRPAIARQTTTLPALRPRKLGHINRLTGEMAAVTAFHVDVLGMEVSDYLGEAGTWLHCGPEHHQMALVDTGAPHFHHIAFDYYDFGTLRSLFDGLAQHGRWLSWGPVRHGIAQNICGYVRITEEPLHVECYVDMEILEPDHEPRQWPDDRFSSNTWGPLPPRSYFRFDPAAVESERESRETRGIPLPPLQEV